jgi:alcohol dehydrogenase, propanol-preferring
MATNGVVKEVPLKQRAAQYSPKDNSVHIREIPVPSIKPDELLVKVSSASLCHSDLMLFEPNEQGLILTDKPVTMGHEAVGKVLQVGKESKGFKEGDVVS